MTTDILLEQLERLVREKRIELKWFDVVTNKECTITNLNISRAGFGTETSRIIINVA